MKPFFLESEDHIIKCLSKGDIHAFNTLFKAYSGRLYHFAKIYLKSSCESEELVQEVFTIIWDKRRGLKPDLSFKSYLFTIAFNVIRKHFRTKHYKNDYMKSLINTDLDLQTTEKISYESLSDFLQELVNRMPNRRREIFIKSRFEGLSIKEISQDLEISHKTVENQLTVALKFIRANLRRELL
jgi:RNA polymerase sigma-70 factor (ECF subfamily)